MNTPSPFFARLNRSAFTLVELMVVMAVVGVATSLVAPALTSVVNGSNINGVVSELAGTMEQARQYAVAQNTYVWVALRPVSLPSGNNSIDVVVLASKSGVDPSPWANYGAVPNSDIEMVGKAKSFSKVRLGEAGAFTNSQISHLPDSVPGVEATANSPAADTAVFTVKLPAGAVNFTRAIQFTPSGQARNASSPINLIEFGVQPIKGTVADSRNVAVLRVNGFTGQTMVYRP